MKTNIARLVDIFGGNFKGVYQILFDKYSYIGQSTNVIKRLTAHFTKTTCGNHRLDYFKKNHKEAEVRILATTNNDDFLYDLEYEYIIKEKPLLNIKHKHGYLAGGVFVSFDDYVSYELLDNHPWSFPITLSRYIFLCDIPSPKRGVSSSLKAKLALPQNQYIATRH